MIADAQISHPRHSVSDWVAAKLLLLLMILGSPVLWIGIPLASMWAASKFAENVQQHGTLAILMTVAGMWVFAFFLSWLNALYLHITTGAGAGARPTRYAWNRSMRDEAHPTRVGGRGSWRVSGPLEMILAISFAIALVILIFWFFVLAENPPYVTFGGGSY